jgi:histone H3/H4
VRKKRDRRRSSSQGANALKQIRRFQDSTQLLIPKVAYQRLVKEVAASIDGSLRFQVEGIIAVLCLILSRSAKVIFWGVESFCQRRGTVYYCKKPRQNFVSSSLDPSALSTAVTILSSAKNSGLMDS